MDQRHVAAAGVDELLRIDVDPAQAAGLAPHADDEAGPLRRAWRGEIVRHQGSPDAKKPQPLRAGAWRDCRLVDRLCAAALVLAGAVDGNRNRLPRGEIGGSSGSADFPGVEFWPSRAMTKFRAAFGRGEAVGQVSASPAGMGPGSWSRAWRCVWAEARRS